MTKQDFKERSGTWGGLALYMTRVDPPLYEAEADFHIQNQNKE